MSGTYSFADYQFSIKGPGLSLNLSDAAIAEEGIDWEFDQDANIMTKGANKAVMHNRVATAAGRCTIRLLKTSPANAILGQAYILQDANSIFWGNNTIVGVHSVLQDKFTGIQSAYKKFPNVAYKVNGGFLEWGFDVGILSPMLGAGTFADVAGILSNLGL